jgi:NADH oxidase (H2O2-forming)
MTRQTDVFVIGTGPAGMTAARTAKRKRPDLSVTAIRREPSYVPCALPYALSKTIKVDSYVKDEDVLMGDIGIDILDGEVARIAPDQRKLVLEDGREYCYGKLIAAPGARPFVPPIPGASAGNVLSLRTPADIHAILRVLQGGARVAVVGAGYIGLEVVCALSEAGHNVDLIELRDCLLPNTTDSEFSHMVRQKLQERDISIHLGAALAKMIRNEDDAVESLVLDNGSVLHTDLVVLCLGVRPRLRLFEDAGIRTAPDGVVVDDHMRTSAPDVYACGDCTHFASFVTGEPIPGKLATNGVFQGKTAALNALGVERVFDGFINTCVTDVFGLRLGSTGIREEDAVQAEMDVVPGIGLSRSAYPMFPDSGEVKVKLVVERESGVVVGGQVAGSQGVAERLDLIALAIHQRLDAADLIKLNHCAHPVQSGVPAHNPIVMAAEDALARIQAG